MKSQTRQKMRGRIVTGPRFFREAMEDFLKNLRLPGPCTKKLANRNRSANNRGEIIMKIKSRIFVVSALLFPMFASAEDWTKEQQEVLAFEEACVTAKTADVLIGCFHQDYVGWGMGSTVPISKADLLKVIANDFESFDSDTLLFKPVSVIVKGNMAVVSYIQSGKTKNKATDEVEYYTQRWTDVCLKEGGKWTWISDHGVDLSSD